MKKNVLYICLLSLLATYSCTTSCKKENKFSATEPFYFNDDSDFVHNNKFLSDTGILGKQIFFDASLSEPVGISCGTCHSPSSGFADGRHTAFSVGIDPLNPSDRNTISIAYNILAPDRHGDFIRGLPEEVGGYFWDGRAEFIEAQVTSPLLNPKEMNNKDIGQVASKIRKAPYFNDLKKLFKISNTNDDQVIMYATMLALKSFQTSKQVNPYTSKFDFFLQGKVKLSDAEMRGWKLFQDTTKSKCSLCHLSEENKFTNTVVFADFSYDNIGVPKHPSQIHLPLDSGFAKAEFVGKPIVINPLEIGRFKTASLRNINKTAPYMHNGVFETLEEVLEFYNTRDVNAKYIPEYTPTMNTEDMGDLKLSDTDIADIIAFLKTLDDGYRLK